MSTNQTYRIVNNGTTSPTPPTYTSYESAYTSYDSNIKSQQIHVDASKVVLSDGDTLEERLQRIEQALGIPTRNINFEKNYPHLKQINERSSYNDELHRCRAFDRLKQ